MDPILEQLMGTLGTFGRYQKIQFFAHSLAAICAGLNIVTLIATAPIPDHRCFIPDKEANFSTAEKINFLKPLKEEDDFDACFMFDNKTETFVRCDSYVWCDEVFKTSRTVEWNMVCDQKWKRQMGQTIFMLGAFVGVASFACLSDKYGRKTIYNWAGVCSLAFGIAEALNSQYMIFLIIRFLNGCLGSGIIFITALVMFMELIAEEKRILLGVTYISIFGVSKAVVGFWGFFLHDITILQVVFSMHSLSMCIAYYFVDESPRRLWQQGHFEEALTIVKMAVSKNKNSISFDYDYFINNLPVKKSDSNMQENIKKKIFKKLHIEVVVIFFNWFAMALVYYSLLIIFEDLPGNQFTKLIILSVVDLICYLVTISFIMKRISNERFIILSSFFNGCMCLIFSFIPRILILLIPVVILMKFVTTCLYLVIFIHTAELYPTIVQNFDMHLAEMCCRLAGALPPVLILFHNDKQNLNYLMLTCGVVAIAAGLSFKYLAKILNEP